MHPPRDDAPGTWWLITNRGLAKRPVFETGQDVERFLDCLRRAVDRGDLEVHAFTIMTTHFHLLVRSPRGLISEVMQEITNRYVRWFNRTHRRDGPLFRSRFHGRKILDALQWEIVLRYIDRNPVRAHMVARPSDHVHGSARAYRWGAGPEWLTRSEVERVIREFYDRDVFDPADVDAFASTVDDDVTVHLVERTLRSPKTPFPPIADLVRAASDRQQTWMAWKARLADASILGTAFVSPTAALRAANAAARVLARRQRPTSRSDVNRDLAAGLLRHASGLTLREIAETLQISGASVHGALRRHDLRLKDNPAYEELALRVLRTAVRRSLATRRAGQLLGVRVGAGEDLVAEIPGGHPGTADDPD